MKRPEVNFNLPKKFDSLAAQTCWVSVIDSHFDKNKLRQKE